MFAKVKKKVVVLVVRCVVGLMPDRKLDFEEWEVVRANFPKLPSYDQYIKIGKMVQRCWREKYHTDVIFLRFFCSEVVGIF